MTEKEKLQNGNMYIVNEEMLKEMDKCKELCNEFNQIYYTDKEKANEVLKRVFGSFGDNFQILPNFICDYGYNISIGKNFYSNHNLTILDPAKVTIGDYVFFGPNVNIYTAGHSVDADLRKSGNEFGKPITIGNNVWVGGNVTILPGVNIGDNTIIGAGSVVTKDIPSNVLAVGNPCKIKKEI